jgi:hypothetical protein
MKKLLLVALFAACTGGDSSEDGQKQMPAPPDAAAPVTDAGDEMCLAEGDGCGALDTCCRGSCESGRCQCQSSGLCFGESDCCDGYACSDGECRGIEGSACAVNIDCAVGLVCHEDTRSCGPCKTSGQACSLNVECCDALAGCGFDNLCR